MNNDIINFPKARVRKAIREQRRKDQQLQQTKQEIKEYLKSKKFELEVVQFTAGLLKVFENTGLFKNTFGGSTVISEPLEPIEPEYTVL